MTASKARRVGNLDQYPSEGAAKSEYHVPYYPENTEFRKEIQKIRREQSHRAKELYDMMAKARRLR